MKRFKPPKNRQFSKKEVEEIGREISRQATHTSFVNWEIYQCDDVATDKDTDKELTKSRQRADKEPTNRLTTNKNKEIKNFKEKEINKEKERFGEFENVLLTADEYRKLSEKFPMTFGTG